MKPLCAKCEVEFKPEKNGIKVAELYKQNTEVYRIWQADLWKCPVCGAEIVAGYGQLPRYEHFHQNLEAMVESMKAFGERVVYNRELLG
jgi:hypothetical protein